MSGTSNIPGWIEKAIEKAVMTLQNDVIKKKIQILILDPFMTYVIERLFPYVLFLVVIFAIFIVLCVICIGIIVYKMPWSSASAAAAAAAALQGT